MRKKLYFISSYVRCGEMPLFLIFYHDKRGNHSHCAMLCTHKNLRSLLKQRRGFTTPSRHGKVLYTGHAEGPSEMLKLMLRERYAFDFDQYEASVLRPS